MRRFLVVLAAMPALARAADISAGTLALSGFSNLDVSRSSSKLTGTASTDSTSIGLFANGLYYAFPNVGFGVGLGSSWVESTASGRRATTSSVTIGPALELDFPQTEQTALFVRGGAGYTYESFGASGSPSRTARGWEVDAGLGLKYFVVKAFSIDAGVAYTYAELSGQALSLGGTSRTASASNLGLSVGLSVYLGR